MTPQGALAGLILGAAVAAAVGGAVRSPGRAQGPVMAWGPYRELCARWALYWGVPVQVLEVVGMLESSRHPGMIENTDPRAVARGGSWGLFGLTMATAADEMRLPELAHNPTAALWDATPGALFKPELSAMIAAHYLATLWSRFGSFIPTIAAYHSGPETVERILGHGGDLGKELGPHGRDYIARAADAFVELAQQGRHAA